MAVQCSTHLSTVGMLLFSVCTGIKTWRNYETSIKPRIFLVISMLDKYLTDDMRDLPLPRGSIVLHDVERKHAAERVH